MSFLLTYAMSVHLVLYQLNTIILPSPGNDSYGYDMGWWKEEHFNVSDADGDGLLNITEFNE